MQNELDQFFIDVYNKARNRLSSAKAKKLVYIYTNAQLAWERVVGDSTAWYPMNMMSKDSTDQADKILNDDPLARPNGESYGCLYNNSDGGLNGKNLGLDNPNDPFTFDGDDVAYDNELHI